MDSPCIPSSVFKDPRYDDLTPSQIRALPRLLILMQEYGREGVLAHFTRRQVYRAVGLRRDIYEDFLVKITDYGWGCENSEGWLVLCGPLAPAPSSVSSGLTRADVLEILREHDAQNIRRHEADRKRRYRSGTAGEEEMGMSGTTAPNVPDNQSETGPNVPDIPSYARAFDSNRIESSVDILSTSNRFDSKDAEPPAQNDAPSPAALAPSETPPKLTMVPADVVQQIVNLSITEKNARAAIAQHGLERCVVVLASLPYWKKAANKARAFHAALEHPEQWPIPPEVLQQDLSLLTGIQGGSPPKPDPAAKMQKGITSLKLIRAGLTEAELKLLRIQASDRLSPAERAEFDKNISLERPHGLLLSDSLRATEDRILMERLAKAQKAVGE